MCMCCFSMALSLNRCFLCVFLLLLCFNSLSCAGAQTNPPGNFIDFQVNSLFPREDLTCNHSPIGKRQGVSLEVVHRHGPCYKVNSTSSQHVFPSHSDLLLLDQYRVDSIHARLSGRSVDRKSDSLPARSDMNVGSSNYIVKVGLGTPKKDLHLVFDTGSDITWTQCKLSYKQKDPIFDPTSSSSYSNVSCDSTACSVDLLAAWGSMSDCSSTCKYRIGYADKSFSQGFLAKERLTLTSNDYIDNFVFGCGEENKGIFSESAGMIGLGRTQLSLVSQAADKYGKYFSYCLPPSPSSTGYLTLGKGSTITATSVSYTPLLTGPRPLSSYYVELQSISVNGRRLAIPPSVFSAAGTLVDSGTVISRLPRPAYSALRAAFKKYMSKYPKAPPFTILDTCYDLSNYTTVQVPKVTLYFGGGGVLDLPETGIIVQGERGKSQACLAFAGNSHDKDSGIVGNVQQKGFDVVYDVAGGRIGFAPNGC